MRNNATVFYFYRRSNDELCCQLLLPNDADESYVLERVLDVKAIFEDDVYFTQFKKDNKD